jgi:hypothetical protein
MSTSPTLGARAQLIDQLMDFRNDFYGIYSGGKRAERAMIHH